MRLVHVFMLFGLLHGSTQKKETMRFVHTAVETLQSYQDGSINQTLEADRIHEIQENIVTLTAHPKAAGNVRLMSIVTQEMAALRDYDDALQRGLMEQFKPEPIV